MALKKVLIITYYWPPGGGAGVQRWLKFVKYLRLFGWEPVVYTPSNGEMPVIDESLLKDIPEGTQVIKREIWEPYSIYKKFVGAGKNEKINTGFLTENKRPGLTEKLSVWLRGNIFIPDARCFWIKPSVAFLSDWLKNNRVDAIASTGPPHSMHLIALKISKTYGLPWLADFRDPWTNIDFYKDLMLTGWADRKHHQLEREVVTSASRVVVVGRSMKEEFENRYNRNVDVITNGFDTDDILKVKLPLFKKFTLSHVGTLVRSRNPEKLWAVLSDLVKTSPVFKSEMEIRLIGKVDLAVKESLRKFDLEDCVTYVDYLPHDHVAIEQARASILLLILNNTPNAKGIITGKLFEYIASGRPVICIGPSDGDAAKIIKETGTGITSDFEDYDGIRFSLVQYYRLFIQGLLNPEQKNINKYSRKELTRKLAAVLDEMIADGRGQKENQA